MLEYDGCDHSNADNPGDVRFSGGPGPPRRWVRPRRDGSRLPGAERPAAAPPAAAAPAHAAADQLDRPARLEATAGRADALRRFRGLGRTPGRRADGRPLVAQRAA